MMADPMWAEKAEHATLVRTDRWASIVDATFKRNDGRDGIARDTVTLDLGGRMVTGQEGVVEGGRFVIVRKKFETIYVDLREVVVVSVNSSDRPF